MATYKQAYNVGDFVYESFRSQNPGKVMKILGNDFVEVKLLNGTVKQVSIHYLADFNGLIADHKKKLDTHTSKLPYLRGL